MKIKKALFMIKKLFADVFNKSEPFRISNDIHNRELKHYYFLFEEDPAKLNKLISAFDENGIPLNSAYIDVAEPKLHYYPISIGQYALAIFNTYVETKSEEKKKLFLNIADWFLINAVTDEILGTFWLTDIPKPEYKVYTSWKSAFTQSRAISVLLRAWQLTGEEKYLSLASSALTPFKFDISKGGVAVVSNSTKFYEEYVAAEPTLVLDGHIFS
ncbi:MAG: D-glucuronyl C5-epimerase family protein, partial [Bacteroidetes bacterium]|nr:D-glucuronyl C5-epimerase family protein [Bacteroidota bacterium]